MQYFLLMTFNHRTDNKIFIKFALPSYCRQQPLSRDTFKVLLLKYTGVKQFCKLLAKLYYVTVVLADYDAEAGGGMIWCAGARDSSFNKLFSIRFMITLF